MYNEKSIKKNNNFIGGIMTSYNVALRTARRAAALTALELARRAETREQRIYAFERLHYRPRPDEAVRIAAALREPVEKLFPQVMA